MSKHYAMCYFDDASGNYIPMEVRLDSDLSAENAALRAEVERLSKLAYIGEHQFDDNTWKHRVNELRQQLAASQLEAKRLREALERVINTSGICAHDTIARKALSSPTSIEALDAYVAEKVKHYRPEFYQMREMLRAMQAGELTVSRGLEILDMWWAGNWNDEMLPPVRQDLIEEDSMPVEIIDRITRQRDLAVSALRHVRCVLPNETWAYDTKHMIEAAIKESEV